MSSEFFKGKVCNFQGKIIIKYTAAPQTFGKGHYFIFC